jgi:hypothetical protein
MLTRKEMERFYEAVSKRTKWFADVLKRMEQRGEFRDDKKTYDLTRQAYDALHTLMIHTHYARCDGTGLLNERPEG